MTRNTTLVRVLQLMELLLRQPMTIADIAREFDVCRRTVIRDLAAINRAGALVTLRRTLVEGDRGGPAFSYRAHLTVGTPAWTSRPRRTPWPAAGQQPRAAQPATHNLEVGR